jgi:hypothetical protein
MAHSCSKFTRLKITAFWMFRKMMLHGAYIGSMERWL